MNTVQWGITTIFAILSFLAGRYWDKIDKIKSKDKKTMEKFDEIFPFEIMDNIHCQLFGESFDNKIFRTMDKLSNEAKNPDFFFIDDQLEKIKQDFIIKLSEFSHLLAMNSWIVNDPDFSRIPRVYEFPDKEEQEVIKKVETLADNLFDIYSQFKKEARRKL